MRILSVLAVLAALALAACNQAPPVVGKWVNKNPAIPETLELTAQGDCIIAYQGVAPPPCKWRQENGRTLLLAGTPQSNTTFAARIDGADLVLMSDDKEIARYRRP